MFTGIIEEVGKITQINKQGDFDLLRYNPSSLKRIGEN